MNKDITYCRDVLDDRINAPKYVKKQCGIYLAICDGEDEKYTVNQNKRKLIENITRLMIVPRGLSAGKTVNEILSGFQWLFIFALLTVVWRKDPDKRRYQIGILEICRKNGKTFLVAVIFLCLFLTEPQFSKFYSVAPDGSLSREIQTQIREIIAASPALMEHFKIRRDDILCLLNNNDYFPLAYSTSRLDGKLPNAFVADEVGALPEMYPVEAMKSGQLNIKNKLGCIISTKYPTLVNPFEEIVEGAKKILDGLDNNDRTFALLYEPDETKDWETNDSILEQANPLALDIPEIMQDLKDKRHDAILMPSQRENFLTKHCNIIYSGMGTQTYIPVEDIIQCEVDEIDWCGKTVYLGVDLSETEDNSSVAMAGMDNDEETLLLECISFVPADRVDEKSRVEKLHYREFIEAGHCIACGGRVIDYGAIERYVFDIEKRYGCKVAAIGYDRRNAMSSAQKWSEKYETVEIRQHSSVLHPAFKLLKEKVLEKKLKLRRSRLTEINFQNTRIRYDTNMNIYADKKRSKGKIDEVFAAVDAVYLVNEFELLKIQKSMDWGVVF